MIYDREDTVYELDEALRIFDKYYEIAKQISYQAYNYPAGSTNFDIKLVADELRKIEEYIENVIKQNVFLNEEVSQFLEIIKTACSALRSSLSSIQNIQIPLVISTEQLDRLLMSFGFNYLSLPVNTKKLILEELVANYKIKGTLASVENIVRKFVPNLYIVELNFSKQYMQPKFIGKRKFNLGGNIEQTIKFEFDASHADADKYWHLTQEELENWPVNYAMSPYFAVTYAINLTTNLLASAMVRHRAKLDLDILQSGDEQAYRNSKGLTVQSLPDPFNYLELYLMIRYIWMKMINLYVNEIGDPSNLYTYGYIDDTANSDQIKNEFQEYYQNRNDAKFSCIKTYKPKIQFETEDCTITTNFQTGNGKIQERFIPNLEGSGFAVCGNNLIVLGGRDRTTGEPNNKIYLFDMYFQSYMEVEAEVNLYKPVIVFCGCERVLVFGGYKMKTPPEYYDDLYDTTDIYDKLIENFEIYSFSLRDFVWRYEGKIPRELWMTDPHVIGRGHQYIYTISTNYEDPLPGAIYRINIESISKFLVAILDPETYDVSSSQVVIDDHERLWFLVRSKISNAQRLILLDPVNDVFVDVTQMFLFNMPDWQRHQVREALASNQALLVSIGNDPSIFWTHGDVTYSYQIYLTYDRDKLKDVIKPVKVSGPLIPTRRCYVCGPDIIDMMALLYDTRVIYDTLDVLEDDFKNNCDAREICESYVRRFQIEHVDMCVIVCNLTEAQKNDLIGPEVVQDDMIKHLEDVIIVPVYLLDYICSKYDTNKFYDPYSVMNALARFYLSALTLRIYDPIKVRQYENFYLGFAEKANPYQSGIYKINLASCCEHMEQELFKLSQNQRTLNIHNLQLVTTFANFEPITIVCIDKLPEVMEAINNIYKCPEEYITPVNGIPNSEENDPSYIHNCKLARNSALQWVQNRSPQNYNIRNLLYVLSQFDGTIQYDRTPEMLFNLEPRYQCVYITAMMCYGIIPKLHCTTNAKITSGGNNIGFMMLECTDGTYLYALQRAKALKKLTRKDIHSELLHYTCEEPCEGCMGSHWNPPLLSARCVREKYLSERASKFVLDHDPLPQPANRDELRDLLMQLTPNNIAEIDSSLTLGTIFLELLDIVNSLVPGADIGLLDPEKYEITMDLINIFKPYYARPLQAGISTSILDPIGNWIAMGDCVTKETFMRMFSSVLLNECVKVRNVQLLTDNVITFNEIFDMFVFMNNVKDYLDIYDYRLVKPIISKQDNIILYDTELQFKLWLSLDQILHLNDRQHFWIQKDVGDNLIITDNIESTYKVWQRDEINFEDEFLIVETLDLVDNLVLSDSIKSKISTQLDSTLELDDDLHFTVTETLQDTLNLHDSVHSIVDITYTDNLTLSDLQKYNITLTLEDNVNFTEDWFWRIRKDLYDNITLDDHIRNLISLEKLDLLILSDEQSFRVTQKLEDNLTFAEDWFWSIGKTLDDHLVLNDIFQTGTSISFVDNIVLDDIQNFIATEILYDGFIFNENMNFSLSKDITDYTNIFDRFIITNIRQIQDHINLYSEITKYRLFYNWQESILLGDQFRIPSITSKLEDSIHVLDRTVIHPIETLIDIIQLHDSIHENITLKPYDNIGLNDQVDISGTQILTFEDHLNLHDDILISITNLIHPYANENTVLLVSDESESDPQTTLLVINQTPYGYSDDNASGPNDPQTTHLVVYTPDPERLNDLKTVLLIDTYAIQRPKTTLLPVSTSDDQQLEEPINDPQTTNLVVYTPDPERLNDEKTILLIDTYAIQQPETTLLPVSTSDDQQLEEPPNIPETTNLVVYTADPERLNDENTILLVASDTKNDPQTSLLTVIDGQVETYQDDTTIVYLGEPVDE